MLPTIRDLAIILLAVEFLIIGGLLIVLVWQIWRLVRLLESEIKPLLDSANDTVNTVRGTSDFVSEKVVKPVVRVHSFVAGVKGGFRSLFKDRKRRTSSAATSKSDERDLSDHAQDKPS